jgi:hypothetical protein
VRLGPCPENLALSTHGRRPAEGFLEQEFLAVVFIDLEKPRQSGSNPALIGAGPDSRPCRFELALVPPTRYPERAIPGPLVLPDLMIAHFGWEETAHDQRVVVRETAFGRRVAPDFGMGQNPQDS